MTFSYVLVFLGGGVGSVLRALLAGIITSRSDEQFPLGILLVNVIGCFLIGLLDALLPEAGANTKVHERDLLMLGLLGGFTTFSSFSLQTLALLRQGAIGLATLNIIANVTLCLLAAGLGHAIGRIMAGAR